MSPFGAWLLVYEQLHYITNREEIFYFVEKICRIYAACGVSQTPIFNLKERMLKSMMWRKSNRRLWSAVLASVMVFSCAFTGESVYGIQSVGATGNEKTADIVSDTKGESAAYSGTDTDTGKEIIADTEEDGMYYNSNSAMRDFRDETIYFVMTTRFYDGDPSNNVQCWDGKGYNGDETPWKGDFRGLIDKLDYIKALGFTAIWITPVVKNASGYDYHGYHAMNFMEVDSRYESDGCTYQELIDAVHARGMKIIQDVVFNHTGNFGEENLMPLFSRDDDADLSNITDCMIPNEEYLPKASEYYSLEPGKQYGMRLDYMKNHLKLNKKKPNDPDNLWHHFGEFNWDDYTCQLAQIAGDCVDLNTENPKVYKYLVKAYSKYIDMGVDAFRVDTVRHISRLSLNKGFINQLNEAYNKKHGTTGERNFYMFGEVCTRYSSVWYREVPALSTPFYTWKESKDYEWNDDENDPDAYVTNEASAEQHYEDNAGNISAQPTSDNAFLKGNEYHTPDYTESSGLDVIDFPMHWNFKEAKTAYNIATSSDKYYNDATYNVVYVDSHDYAPDHAPEDERYAGSQEQWAENLSLMFTFRGIPCIYYGSEVEFMKGKPIDKGPNININETGRAYFGDYLEGSVDVVDFAKYSNATGTMKGTLNYPLSLHIQRLNRLRAAIPALRKGQYSTEGCSGSFAYKRRYTDDTTDSFALIALTSDATFTGIPDGKYTDAITGDIKTVNDGTLETSGIKGKGDLRVYVLDTNKTKAPGVIEGKSSYMSGGKDIVINTVSPKGISIIGDKSVTLDLGETATFKAQIVPADATNKTVTWTSSNPSVATVGATGKVIAKGEGTATIYAATCNAKESDYTGKTELVAVGNVTVKATGVKVTEVSVSKKSVSLAVGESEKINTTIVPPNASANYTTLSWTSADTSVAKVNRKGEITAVKKGNTTITVTTASGVSSTIEVEVKNAIIRGDAIYFKKPSTMGKNVYAYMWTDDNTYKNSSWPGEMMSVTDDVNGIYGIKWPDGISELNIIFSDGSNQTKDLKTVKNVCIDSDGKLVESEIETNPETEKPSENKPSESTTMIPGETDTTKPGETDTTKPGETDTTKPGEIETTKPGETDTTKPGEIETTKPGEIETTKPGEIETTKPGEIETTKPGEVETTKPGEVETTKPGETETTKPGEIETTKPGEIETTKPDEVETTKPGEIETTKPDEVETTKPDETANDVKIKYFKASVLSGRAQIGDKITLKVVTKNSDKNTKYKFVARVSGKNYVVKAYSNSKTVKWKPKKAGKYTIVVYAKNGRKIVKKSIKKYLVNDVFKITKLKINGGNAKKVNAGKKVLLNVKASGGTKHYKYKYVYKYKGKTKKITAFSSGSSVRWKPLKKGTYTIIGYVKDTGTGKVIKKSIKIKVI